MLFLSTKKKKCLANPSRPQQGPLGQPNPNHNPKRTHALNTNAHTRPRKLLCPESHPAATLATLLASERALPRRRRAAASPRPPSLCRHEPARPPPPFPNLGRATPGHLSALPCRGRPRTAMAVPPVVAPPPTSLCLWLERSTAARRRLHLPGGPPPSPALPP